MQVPLFAALWATCDGSGIIGGVSYETSAAGEAAFGTVDPKGAYTKKSTVQVTPGLEPSGLLTATSPQVRAPLRGHSCGADSSVRMLRVVAHCRMPTLTHSSLAFTLPIR